jgi:glycosyltransferase involved in cell wall biosynthesis
VSMRIAIVMNMIAPYTTAVFEHLAQRADTELFVVYETAMEPSRQWKPQRDLPYGHALLQTWTVDLSWLAVGSGFKTREDTYLYLPKRPFAALSQFSPDVVIAAGGGIWSSPANLAALAARRRCGWAYVPWWGSFLRTRPTLPRRLADPWVRMFIRSSDAWMAYGTRASVDLVRLGADPARIVIAPLVATRAPGRSPPRRQKPAGEPVRYLFVGRLIERKGIDVLLDAFREVDGGELWIAGDGPLRPLVQRAAADDAHVRLLGHVDGVQLERLYREADVLVLPSYYDVWGLVVNEAQVHGLPVIASDEVGAAADLVDDGVNGLVVPTGSSAALARAMNEIAGWTAADRRRCYRRSKEKRDERSAEAAADAIFEASVIALEHRQRHSRQGRQKGAIGAYFRRRNT